MDPGVLGRRPWEREQGLRDLEVLAWVDRLRFVTAEAMGEYSGQGRGSASARVRPTST